VTAASYRRRPDVLWRRSLDSVVLLPAGSDDVITVSGTGADVWDLLETERSIEGLVGLLCEHYRGDPAIVALDVEQLVADLAGRGVLEVAAESGGPGEG